MISGILALSPLITGIMNIVSKVVGDKDTQAEIEREITMYTLTSDFQNAMAQIEVAKVDQTSDNMWKAGWRPFIGWICGTSFAWHFVLCPIIMFIGSCFHYTIPVPVFDEQGMMTVMLGMLGLGGYRTYEKMNDRKLTNDERLCTHKLNVESLKESKYGPSSTNFDVTNPKIKTKKR